MQIKEVSFTTNLGYVNKNSIWKGITQKKKLEWWKKHKRKQKERIAKRRLLQQQRLQGRPMRINAVTLTEFEEEMVDPIIQVRVGTNQVHAHALIDLGAQGNLISLDLYNQLKNTEQQESNSEI